MQEVIETDTLYSNSDFANYVNIAYWVKGAASKNDLDNFEISDDLDWVSTYVKNEGEEKKYRRIDILKNEIPETSTTLDVVLGDSISISDLYQDYEEWFYDKNNERKYIRLNIKQIKKSPKSSAGVFKYERLFTKSDDNRFVLNAYKVNSGARAADLYVVVISDTAYKVTIYKNDGTNIQLWASNNIQGKSLQEIFTANFISVSNLDQNRVEWFLNSFGEIALLNINVKEEWHIVSVPNVTEDRPYYNIGSTEEELIYENTAFMVSPDATDAELKSFSIPAEAHYVVVKQTLGRS